MDATNKGVGGWGGWAGLKCPQTQVTKLCAQWARQMATATLTIPRGQQALSGTVWEYMPPY